MKKNYVADLREGARVEDVFLVASKIVAQTRGGSPFLKLRLADKTGTIDAVKWDATEAELSRLSEDDYAYFHGTVKHYNGNLQMNLDAFRICDEPVDPADFIACTPRDRDEMMAELLKLLAGVKNNHLRQLLDSFFADPKFAAVFCESPAAAKVHHAYIGGLLEHTLGVTRSAAMLADLYPDANKDLLIAAAALHDAGKVDEFQWSGAIRYSDAGYLVGHIVGGAMMVKEAAQKIEGFDPVLSLALQHAILAHHGLKEYGSPKQPKSLEAMILHHADDLDAQVAMVRKAVEESDANGEDGLFTKRHYFLERPIFRGLPGQDPAHDPSSPDSMSVPGSPCKEEAVEFDADSLAADADYDPFADE